MFNTNKFFGINFIIILTLLGGAFNTTPIKADALLQSPGPIRFAVIGDYGIAGQPELDVANRVKSWNPEFIITTGDNNYNSGSASTIDQNIGQYYHDYIYPYTGSYGSGAATNQFFPTLGNHDWDAANAQPYLNYFTLPGNERYYDFVKGPVHFFVIDSDSHEPHGITSTSTQALWLQSRLAASTSVWKIVYLHHPPFSSGGLHGSTTALQWPFAAWGADAVLAGHDHTYERILKNGIPYFVNGLGGKNIYTFGTPISGSQVRYNGDHGAMLVDASETEISFQFITRTGTVIDSHTLPVNKNMNVHIGGALQGSYFLTAGESTRATYGVNNGPVKVSSTNGTSIIASERVAYFNGTAWTNFSEVMGMPDNQTTTAYWFPWYNNVDLNTQLRFANVSGSPTSVIVTIGGVPQTAIPLAAGASTRVSYPVNNGPVKVEAGGKIISSMRVAYFNGTAWSSFSEVMGMPDNQTTAAYWFPWYNNIDLNTQLRFANVSGSATSVTVTIGGVSQPAIPLAAGESTRVSYPINDGPVKVEAGRNIVASLRVAYFNGTAWTNFSEVMGMPDNQTTTAYWFPWYNNVDLNTQLRFANVSGSPTSVTVTIGGVSQPAIPLAAGASTRVSYPINDGPVKVEAGGKIVASMRVAYFNGTAWSSFSEVMGMPDNQTTTAYWFPWYNNVELNTQLRFGVP